MLLEKNVTVTYDDGKKTTVEKNPAGTDIKGERAHYISRTYRGKNRCETCTDGPKLMHMVEAKRVH